MRGRVHRSALFLLASLLSATTALSLFYLSDLITTIGSSLEIPFILSGFITGSVFFPAAAYFIFRKSMLRTVISSLSVPLAFVLMFAAVFYSKIVSNYEMFFFSFISVAGNIFIVSLFSLREGSTMASAIGIGLGGLFVMTVMLIVYAALFDSHMPLIILSGDALAAVMLLGVAFLGRTEGAAS